MFLQDTLADLDCMYMYGCVHVYLCVHVCTCMCIFYDKNTCIYTVMHEKGLQYMIYTYTLYINYTCLQQKKFNKPEWLSS